MEEQVTVNMPALGDKAPAFKAVTTTGEINFPDDYRGKWVVLFSHPADFTPVCTSEIATFAAMRDDFHELNTELIGLSIDSNNSHLAWIKEIQDNIRFGKYDGQPVDFPIIADIKAEVARKYGMDDVLDACRYYIEKTGRRVIFEYALVHGVNADPAQAVELAGRLRGMQCHVNLIPLNSVPERGLTGVTEREVDAFKHALEQKGISVTRRREMGDDIEGACGQLRRRYIQDNNLNTEN